MVFGFFLAGLVLFLFGVLLAIAGAFDEQVHRGGRWLAAGLGLMVIGGLVLGGAAERMS